MKTRRKFIPIPKDIGDYIAYSEESKTGLVWKKPRPPVRVGQEAGGISNCGYFTVGFNRKRYRANRVIYFLCKRIDPEEKHVDHIDGNKLNNKISNLRLATNKQNLDNRKKSINNTSGVTGLYWHKRRNKYAPSILCNGKLLDLGYFNKPDRDKAIAVRIAAGKDPRFKDQEFRHPQNDEHAPSPEMLEWAKQYLEDRIERLNWNI